MKKKVEILVLSDIHLGSKSCKAAELLNYLKSIKPQIIILNGDIIDTQQLSNLPSDHLRVINRLMKLMSNGTRIYYLTGNKDASLRRFADFSSGNFFLREQLVLQLGDKKFWFIHGNILDNFSWYKRIAAYMLKPLYACWATLKNDVTPTFLDDKYEEAIIKLAHTEGYNAVVCGHSHQPKISKNESIQYLNSGDWVENMTALEFSYGEWHLYRYDPLDYDLINPKLHIKNQDLDSDELKLLQPTTLIRKQKLKKPKEYILIRQLNTHDWIHNDSVWDGIEY